MEASMDAVMIRCSATGQAVATGLEMDLAKFRRTAVFFSRSYCPYCLTQHEWFAKEAWVEESTSRESTEAA
jgi:hypothetical protein